MNAPNPNAPTTATVTHHGPPPTRALAQLQRALHVARFRRALLRVGQRVTDAALPTNSQGALGAWASTWAEVAQAWAADIARDALKDVLLPPPGLTQLAIDPRDGALVREAGGGGGLAYLPAALGQAVTLMMHGVPRERNVANVMHHEAHPPARSLLWEDLREASKRSKPALLRLYRHAQTGLVTLRAVLSERYPTGYFDDEQLLTILGEIADPTLPARFSRGVFESRAQIILSTGVLQGLRSYGASPLLHVRNSETGDGRLGFWAGLRLDVLDEVVAVRRGGGVAVEEVGSVERAVTVATATGRTERNHTLPWVKWTEAERKAEADRRMRESRDVAIREVVLLAAAWQVACCDCPQGFAPSGGRDVMTVEVLLDLLESHGHLTALDVGEREKLKALMQNEKRLPQLAVGSAAYMAGAFACLARDAKTQEDADRWQEHAGSWVEDGWRGEGTAVEARRRARAETNARLDALKANAK